MDTNIRVSRRYFSLQMKRFDRGRMSFVRNLSLPAGHRHPSHRLQVCTKVSFVISVTVDGIFSNFKLSSKYRFRGRLAFFGENTSSGCFAKRGLRMFCFFARYGDGIPNHSKVETRNVFTRLSVYGIEDSPYYDLNGRRTIPL